MRDNRRRIRAGYSPNSFFKAIVGHKLGVPCVLYMLSAPGPRHAVNITENSSSKHSESVKIYRYHGNERLYAL